MHTSGALPAACSMPAMAAGTNVASFHPLVSFAELDRRSPTCRARRSRSRATRHCCPLLAELAESIGAQPVLLPAGGKPAYHAAAMLAAGGLIGLLDAIAAARRAWPASTSTTALAVYAPLTRQALANAERLGVSAALPGPFVRGDVGTDQRPSRRAPRAGAGALPLYLEVARRELAIARRRGDLDEQPAQQLERLLGGGPARGIDASAGSRYHCPRCASPTAGLQSGLPTTPLQSVRRAVASRISACAAGSPRRSPHIRSAMPGCRWSRALRARRAGDQRSKARRRCCAAATRSTGRGRPTARRTSAAAAQRRAVARLAKQARRGQAARAAPVARPPAAGSSSGTSTAMPSCASGMRRRERNGVAWTLPKGTPDDGETIEQTALREVEPRRPASRCASWRRSAPSTTSSRSTADASTRPSISSSWSQPAARSRDTITSSTRCAGYRSPRRASC